MSRQTWMMLLVGAMVLVRAGLASGGLLAPEWTMSEMGVSPEDNPQAGVIVRVWAIRDLVLSGLVLALYRESLRSLLVGCVIIDVVDAANAWGAYVQGGLEGEATLALLAAAGLALVPEMAALMLSDKPSNSAQEAGFSVTSTIGGSES
ncbi:MAG: hypothetical protein AAFU79_16290 [Myxococcota bacterium]